VFKIKKIQNIILILIICLSFAAIARGEYLKTYIELTGGYGGVAMTKWNQEVDQANAEDFRTGYLPNSENISNENQFGVTILSDFSSPIGTISGYINYNYLSVYKTDRVVYFSDGTISYREMSMLRPSYLSGGIRYIYDVVTEKEACARAFVGMDGGLFSTYGFYEHFGYLASGSQYYWKNDNFDFNDSLYLGGSINIGLDIWFSKWIGINTSLGYREANGFVNYTCKNSTIPSDINTKSYYHVDYSGFYIKGGISLCLW
jgi:hypothetical protein